MEILYEISSPLEDETFDFDFEFFDSDTSSALLEMSNNNSPGTLK